MAIKSSFPLTKNINFDACSFYFQIISSGAYFYSCATKHIFYRQESHKLESTLDCFNIEQYKSKVTFYFNSTVNFYINSSASIYDLSSNLK